MNERHSNITVRETNKRKTVKIGSELKPEIVSGVIRKWQSLIDITAKIVGVPSGLIMKLNEETIEVFVKSNTEGNPYEAGEEAKLIYGLYCENVIGTQKQLLVPDATKSKVWKENNPDVGINMISYLGLPINWPDGEVFGTVCLLDKKENHFSADYIDLLTQVKNHIETDLQLLVASKELDRQNIELKQTVELNEKLRNSDKRFRIIFENSLAVMLLIDPETTQIVAANKAAEKFYGWKRCQLEKMKISEINILSHAEIKAEMERARKSERIYFRFKHRLASGEIKDVEIYSGKVEIDGKHYLHSIIHDVTEQVIAEEALKNNEKILRLFVEHSPASIAMFDNQMRYLVYSKRFLADYDLEQRNIIGLSHYEVFPEIPQRWKDIHQRGLKGEILSADNDMFPRANGKMDWIRWEIHPWYKNENEIGGIILFSEVITERKESEEALENSQVYNRMLFEQSQIGLALATLDGKLIDINQSFADIIGRTIEETKQLTYWDITPEKYAIQEQQQLESLEKTGRYGPYEKEYIHKDGHLVPVRLQGLIIEREAEKYIWSSIEDISEQKKAVEKQIKSLNLLNNLATQVPGVVYQYRLYPDGRSAFPYSSPGMWDIYEVTPEEVREDASPVFTRIHPNDYDYIVESITESAKNQTNYESEFRVILPVQGLRWRYCNAKPELLEDGSTLWHGIITDITERKQTEEALSHSHQLMNYIIEHNQSAVAVHDKNLNYVYVSQRYISDYRIKEKNIIGKHHYEIFPDIPEKWREVHQKALKGIVSRADEDIFIRDDGSIDWTRWECRPWFEADGSIGGIIIYTEVINEQKRKEEEVKKLNQRLEVLIESIQQLSSAQSLDTVQELVAKSARKLIGADGASLVFRENDHCFYVNEDAIQPLWKGNKFPMESCISGWVMQQKKPVVIEDVFSDDRIPKDVYKPTFVKSLAMVPINQKEPIGAIGNYWKETYIPGEPEMQLLQTLADAAARAIENINLYAELEDRVNQRTEQLQTVNKELETFTYSVSHDLKAPLRGIDGYSKLLLDEYGGKLDEEASFFIQTIRRSTIQMNRLIEDLLSYSRLERSQFKQEKIALKPFVDTLVANYRTELEKHRFSVTLMIPDVIIIADSTGLSIILRNLMENAIKFTCQKPSPSIEIGLEDNPGSWIICLKDNGVGFDMKYHDRIFEIFQRLQRAEDFPGTGIGLAMVAKAVKRMNGKAWAESIPGEGSSFYIEIPKKL